MVYAVLFIVGLALGSFVNAFVWRWHRQAAARKKPSAGQASRYSILNGRSMCPSCRHELTALDLVPVLSWLWLRGHCRYCKKPISAQYPLVELSVAALFVLSYAFWPVKLQGAEIAAFCLWLLALVGLAILTVYDLRWQLLPNKIVLGVAAIAIVQALVRIFASAQPGNEVINIILGAAVGGGIFYLLFQASAGTWIGGGDVKLGFLLGILAATPGRSFLLIFLAALLGSAASVPLLLAGRLQRSSRVPFGPFLILAVIIVVLFGASILGWYQRTFIPTGV